MRMRHHLFYVFALATAVTAATVTAQTPSGVLTVRMVDSVTGAPLQDVAVSIRRDGVSCQHLGPGPVDAATLCFHTNTNDRGESSWPLPPGDYLLMSAMRPGYTPRLCHRNYEVAANETVVVLCRLQQVASIHGTLLDENGQPLAGIAVSNLRQQFVAGKSWWVTSSSVTTDSQGRFSFSDLDPGEPWRMDTVDVELIDSSTTVTLKPGETRTIDLRARRRPRFDISGHFVKPGVPLSFVTATLERADSSPAYPIVVATSKAGRDGAFTFSQVPESDYRIHVDTGAGTTSYSPSDILSAVVPLTVDRDRDDVEVPLVPGNEVMGRVEFDGHPPPANFTAIGFAFASVSGRETFPRPVARGTPVTNFWTRALAPDQYFLYVAVPPTGDWLLKSAMLNGQDVADVPLDTSAGRVVDIVATFTDRHTNLEGQVREPDGREAADAVVIVFPTDPRGWSNTSARRLRVWEATQRGRFLIPNLPPGEYFIAAVTGDEAPTDEFSMGIDWLRQLARTASRVTLTDEAPLDVNIVLRTRSISKPTR
jgi:hypothetical protein